MTTVVETLLSELRQQNVHLWLEGDRLRYRAPKGGLAPETLEQLRAYKADILAYLHEVNPPTQATRSKIGLAPRGEALPLAPTQQRLWFVEQLESSTTAYNMAFALRMKGELEITILSQSIQEIVRRHEILRTAFPTMEGVPQQVILPEPSVNIPILDLSDRPADLQELELHREIEAIAHHRFNLAEGYLWRFKLVRLAETHHVLLLNIHHIISDGWSIGVLFQELTTLYKAFLQQQPSPLPALPIQYADYAYWQHEWLASKDFQNQLNYWKRHLSGALPALDLPTDWPRGAAKTYTAGSERRILSSSLSQALKALSHREGTTVFVTLLTAFKILLSRHSGQHDIIVGAPAAGRNQVETEGLIGFFINNLVLRSPISDQSTFRDLLRQVQNTTFEAQTYQAVPFEKLVEELQPDRDLNRTPIFQVWFNMLNLEEWSFEVPGLEIEPIDIPSSESKFDLSFYIQDEPDGLDFCFVYNTALFKPERMQDMLAQFEQLLEQVVEQPDTTVSAISLVTPAAMAQLPKPTLSLNAGHQGLIHTDFVQQAQQHPDRIAVQDAQCSWTYGVLEARSNQLAHYLRSHTIQPNDIVAIYGHRSSALVWAILGVLKAGAAFVILDPAYPTARLIHYLNSVNPKGLIHLDASGELPHDLQTALANRPADRPIVCSCRLPSVPSGEVFQEQDINPLGLPAGDYRAYIAFTSGSTGQPKAVVGTHRPVSHFLQWYAETFDFQPTDRVCLLSGLAHDPLLRDIFMPLSIGATLCIPGQSDFETVGPLARWMQQQQISVAHVTPAMMQLLADGFPDASATFQLPSLRYVGFGGDRLTGQTIATLHRLAPQATCVNFYGATETPQVMGYHIVHTPNQAVASPTWHIPIGRGIQDVQLLILTLQQQLAGVGEVGEIYIRTPYLSQGYLNDDALTRSRFLVNPFTQHPEDTMYRTGDYGRYQPDGSVEFWGRRDNQINLRGFRVELGEIEATLVQQDGIQQAVVLAQAETPDNLRLIAFVVSVEGRSLTLEALRRALQRQLPHYMLPSALVLLETIPLTPNGKVDRRALLSSGEGCFSVEKQVVHPTTLIEATLVECWTDLLNIETLSIHDNFFELGGHSLSAARLVARIARTFAIELPMRAVFQFPSVAELAAQIEAILKIQQGASTEQNGSSPSTPSTLIPRRRNPLAAPLTLTQQRLWLLNQIAPDSPFYNLDITLRLRGTLDVDALQQALHTIVERHESLRTTFELQDGAPLQIIAQEWSFNVAKIDLSDRPTPERETTLQMLLQQHTEQPFNLAFDLMLRALLIRLDEHDHVLLLTTHHIVSDGWSLAILLRELTLLYNTYGNEQPSPLDHLPVQYGDFAEWQHIRLTEAASNEPLTYWRKQLAAPPVLDLPTDFVRPSVQTFNGRSRHLQLNAELTQQLKQLSQTAGTTLFVTLLSAFAMLLSRYSSQNDVIIGSPIANRNRPEVEPLIGLFLNTLPLRIDLSDAPTFRDLLQRSKQVALDAYTYQDVPFEQLEQELHPNRDPSQSPWFQVMFALQNFPYQDDIHFSGLSIEDPPIATKSALFDLALVLSETEGELEGSIVYNTDLFTDATIERLLGHFQTLLSAIATHPDQPISTLPLLTPAEQQQLQNWADHTADFPAYPSIHHLFETQAHQTPEAIAVMAQGHSLTYRELNERANQLAHHLHAFGIQPDSLIGLCLDRSLNLLVGILGILKAGGAYVPIDPAYPAERQAYLIADASPVIVLTQQPFASSLAEFDVPLLALDAEWPSIAQYPSTNPESVTTPDHLAYVIYTSGSTGQPKGVLISHQALLNFTQAAISEYQIAEGDRVLQFASISFDAAAEEIYPCLCRGGTLILRNDDVLGSAATLFRHCEEQNISVLDLPTAYWHQLAAEVAVSPLPLPHALRLVIIGGEQAIPARLHQWQSWAIAQAPQAHRLPPQLVNTYGPTETTVVATLYSLPSELSADATSSIPIGRSLPNVSTYVLDQHLQLVPIGVPGELYIGGAGLARGYLNRPELTAARFISHPLALTTRLYKTGDLVKYRPDGLLEFLGRVDDQVKIRGFRIELGEIETILNHHPQVQQAVAAVYQDESGDRQLVAYVVPQEGRSLTLQELRSFLQNQVPHYMVPSAIVVLASIPLTPNGKVDRQSLPNPQFGQDGLQGLQETPCDELELQLQRIWEEVLNVKPIGIHHNFFDLGGHSLRAVQIFTQIKQRLDHDLPLATLFQAPTIAQLATILRQQGWSPRWSSLVAIKPQGTKPPFFFHGGVADALSWARFAHLLAPDQPFYALQRPDLDGRAVTPIMVEQLAAQCIEELKIVQPQGPYFIGGHCFGGMVVFEMAHQLTKGGDEVALLAIIDSYAPKVVNANWSFHVQNFIHQSLFWLQKNYYYHGAEKGLHHLVEHARKRFLSTSSTRKQQKICVELKSESFESNQLNQSVASASQFSKGQPNNQAPAGNVPHEMRYKQAKMMTHIAQETYAPAPYSGQITLFRSERQHYAWYFGSQLGWQHLTSQDVDCIHIKGFFGNLFNREFAPLLAAELQAHLDKAQANCQ